MSSRGGRGGKDGTTSFEETSCTRRCSDKSCQSRLRKGKRLSDDRRQKGLCILEILMEIPQHQKKRRDSRDKFLTCRDERVREEADDVDEGGGRLGNGGGRGEGRGAEEKGTTSSSVSLSLLISGSSLL